MLYDQFLDDRKIHTIESLQKDGFYFWTINDIDYLRALMNLRVSIIVKLNGFFVCLIANQFMSTIEDLDKYRHLNKQDLKNFISFYNAPSKYYYCYLNKKGFLKHILYA